MPPRYMLYVTDQRLRFMQPVMRVHSTKADVPHFPFLFPIDAANAMRRAMNLRYRLLPYHYSLAQQAYAAGGIPIMRPLLWTFPDDDKVAEMTTQWLDGPKLMAAPVLNENNSTTVYLPTGQWYEFNASAHHTGPTTLALTQVALDHVPIFAMAGAVLPLVSTDIQHTGELPGGPLEVQVYGGADGEFEMIEDDGETYDYKSGGTKTTFLRWNDAKQVLSWECKGLWAGDSEFKSIKAVLFNGSGRHESPVVGLTRTGALPFGKSM